MEAIEKKNLLNDEIVMELLELLKQNYMSEETNHTFELCAYIDSLEKKLDSMTEELSNVKQQLKDMQEDTVLNNLRAQVQAVAERLQERCNMIKEQLFAENILGGISSEQRGVGKFR
jgi:septal ring factor EnvC (AmiA/AmiB activator)